MRVLNLYSGIGGNRKLWPESFKVTAIESNIDIAMVYAKLYPEDKILTTDAHEFLINHFLEFDFIWSSPPCQSHTKMAGQNQTPKYIDMKLWQEIIFLKKYFPGSWVVENVEPYYKPLINYTFRIGRHLFWADFVIGYIDPPKSNNFINNSNPKYLMDWLDIHFDEKIYYDGNHCPAQILRNAVHPKIGQHIIKYINKRDLFSDIRGKI